jgi:hypothetical protein
MAKRAPIIAGVVLLALAGTAKAHHTFAMFDRDKVVTLTGTVKEFQWTNPHTWLSIMVASPDGTAVEWDIEGGSPNTLIRKGWKYGDIKPGQKATITIHPLKSGQMGGSLLTITPEGGRTLEDGISDNKV